MTDVAITDDGGSAPGRLGFTSWADEMDAQSGWIWGAFLNSAKSTKRSSKQARNWRNVSRGKLAVPQNKRAIGGTFPEVNWPAILEASHLGPFHGSVSPTVLETFRWADRFVVCYPQMPSKRSAQIGPPCSDRFVDFAFQNQGAKIRNTRCPHSPQAPSSIGPQHSSASSIRRARQRRKQSGPPSPSFDSRPTHAPRRLIGDLPRRPRVVPKVFSTTWF